MDFDPRNILDLVSVLMARCSASNRLTVDTDWRRCFKSRRKSVGEEMGALHCVVVDIDLEPEVQVGISTVSSGFPPEAVVHTDTVI